MCVQYASKRSARPRFPKLHLICISWDRQWVEESNMSYSVRCLCYIPDLFCNWMQSCWRLNRIYFPFKIKYNCLIRFTDTRRVHAFPYIKIRTAQFDDNSDFRFLVYSLHKTGTRYTGWPKK